MESEGTPTAGMLGRLQQALLGRGQVEDGQHCGLLKNRGTPQTPAVGSPLLGVGGCICFILVCLVSQKSREVGRESLQGEL